MKLETVHNKNEELLYEYTEIYKYMSEFQVILVENSIQNDSRTTQNDLNDSSMKGTRKHVSKEKHNMRQNNESKGKRKRTNVKELAGTNSKVDKPIITVFKKKNLTKLQLSNSHNVYEHNLSNPDIDLNDSGKSKVSCVRCRKFKKKCSRSIPECSNCLSLDGLCVYLPRKSKGKKNVQRSNITDFLNPEPTKRLSLPNIHYGSRSTSMSTRSASASISTRSSISSASSGSAFADSSTQSLRRTSANILNYLYQNYLTPEIPTSPKLKKHLNDFGIILN